MFVFIFEDILSWSNEMWSTVILYVSTQTIKLFSITISSNWSYIRYPYRGQKEKEKETERAYSGRSNNMLYLSATRSSFLSSFLTFSFLFQLYIWSVKKFLEREFTWLKIGLSMLVDFFTSSWFSIYVLYFVINMKVVDPLMSHIYFKRSTN
jgi:hypothetical protein